jgi:translation initiation factor IF-1
MSREDLAKFEGKITGTPGGGNYLVTLTNGKQVTAKLSGKMKQFKIRCIVGDMVTVGISPYDLTQGIILFRQKAGGPPMPGSNPTGAPGLGGPAGAPVKAGLAAGTPVKTGGTPGSAK